MLNFPFPPPSRSSSTASPSGWLPILASMVCLFLGTTNLSAQNVNTYTFATTTSTYTALSGATTFSISGGGGTADDGYSTLQNIGFTFRYAGSSFTQFAVNSNGWLRLGSLPSTTTAYAAALSTDPYSIAFCNRDLNNGASSIYSVLTTGTAPNRICKIEAKAFYKYNTAAQTGNAQVWLYEANGKVEIRYGAFATTWTSGAAQVGIKGAGTATTDIQAVTGTWSSNSYTISNTSTSTITIATTNCPASGRMFSWTPPAPTITGISPSSGCANTGTITITGTNFNVINNTYVTIGGTTVQASGFSNTATSITATIGAGTTGTVSVWATGGTATSAATYTVNSSPNAPTFATSPTTCYNGTATITPTSGGGGTGSFNYYTAATGGALLGTGTSFTTPALTASTVYYAEEIGSGGCNSPRTGVNALVLPALTATVATTPVVCGGTTGSLTVTNTTNPITGIWYANDFTSASLNAAQAGLYGTPTASITGGALQLTANTTSVNGALEVLNPNGINPASLSIDFDFTTNAGPTSLSGADGFSISFGDDVVPVPTATNPENGSGSKLKIAFDGYGTSAAGQQGTYVMYNCTTIDQTTTTSGVLASNVTIPGGLAWKGSGSPVHINVSINTSGQLTLTVGGTVMFSNIQLPSTYRSTNKSTWKFEFSGRCGGVSESHIIDNLNIQYGIIPTYEYSADNGSTWQTSNVFNLAPATYTVWERYQANTVCQSNLGNYSISNSFSAGTASASSTSICNTGSSTLTLTSYTPGATIQWQSSTTPGGPYTNIVGANSSTYSVPVVNGNNYYVANVTCASPANNGLSNEVGVNIVIATITNPTPVLCSGNSATLTASGGTSGSQTYLWNAAGGSATTPVITASTANSYTVSITDGACVATATNTVSVNTPSATTLAITGTTTLNCGNTTTLSATITPAGADGPNTLRVPATGNNSSPEGINIVLYDDGGASGSYSNSDNGYTVLNNSGANVITLSGTYADETSFDYLYIYDGVGTGGTLLATYNNSSGGTVSVTGAPGHALTVQFTSDGSVTYSGFAINVNYSQSQVYWFDAATGGNIVATANPYTTGVLTSSTTLYVQHGFCQTTRTTVPVTVNPLPAPTITGATSVCPNSATTLTASGVAGAVFNWYDAAVGGNLVFTGSTFTTPLLNTATNYWVSQTTTGGACVSPLTAWSIAVSGPAAPAVSGTLAICPGNTTTLTASGAVGVTFAWYDAPTGGTLLSSTNTFTTPALNTNTSYYVEQALAGCGTSPRATAAVTMSYGAGSPSITGATRANCGTSVTLVSTVAQIAGGTLNVPASGNNSNPSGNNITLYDDGGPSGSYSNSDNGYTVLQNSGAFTITLSGTYQDETSFDYLRIYDGVGTGGTLLATYNSSAGGTVSVTGAAGHALTVQFTSDGSVTYSGFAINVDYYGVGTTYRWYDAPAGGNLLASTQSFTSPPITANSTRYYAECTIPGATCPSSRAVALIQGSSSIGATPLANNDSPICPGTTVNLTASALVPGGGNASLSSSLSQYIVTPNLASAFTGNDVTLELWFNPTAAGVVVTEQGSATVNTTWFDSQIEVLSTGEVKVSVFNLTPVSLGFISFNTWNHAVVRYNSSTSTLDGLLNGGASRTTVTGTRSAPYPANGLYYGVGATSSTNMGSGAYFNGKVDEFRVWNVAVPNNNILTWLNQEVTASHPNYANLVAYYKFNGNLNDSKNSYTATANGGATTAASSYFSYNWTGANAPTGSALETTPTTGAASGSYTVAGSANGCLTQSSLATNVTISGPASPTVTGTLSVCPGNTTVLTASGVSGSTFAWYDAPTGGNLLSSTNTYTATASTSPTTVYVDQSVAGCGTSAVRTVATVTPYSPPAVAVTPTSYTGCSGQPATQQITVTPNSPGFGGYTLSTIPAAAVAPSGATSAGPVGDDVLSGAVPIGFNFNFYGTVYTNVYLSTNGFISFDATAGAGCCAGQALPSTTAPNNLVAICWGDMTASAGNIDYFNLTAPNRFVVRYTNLPTLSYTGTISGEIILYQNGNIEIHSTAISTTYPTETQGIEGPGGTAAVPVPGRNAAAWTASNSAYRFTPIVPYTYAWSATSNLSALSGTDLYNPVLNTSAALSSTYTVTVTENTHGCTATASTVINVSTTPTPPTVTGTTSLCGAGNTTTLTAASNGSTFTWYDALVGGNVLATTASFTTPALNSSTTYYVSSSNGSCESSRTPVLVQVQTPITGASVALNCATSTISFSAPAQSNITWYQNNFASATLTPSDAAIYGNASIAGGTAILTASAGSLAGSFEVKNPNGINPASMQVDFDLITLAGSAPVADGMSWSYATDVLSAPTNGESGSGSGLRLAFDAYTNTGGCTAGASSNVAGIYLIYGNGTITSPEPTGCTGVLGYNADVSWTNGANKHVTVTIDNLGRVTVMLGATTIFNNVQLPAAYLTANKSTWRHMFSARTGGLYEGHQIDNINIQYQPQLFEYSINGGTTWSGTNTYTVVPATYPTSIRYANSPGCAQTQSLGSVYVPVPATLSPTSATICTGTNTTLTASPSGTGQTYAWSGNAGGVTTSTASVSAAGTYTVSVTDGTCVTTASAVITNLLLPTATAALSPGTVCIGSAVNLTSTGTGAYPSNGYTASVVTFNPRGTGGTTALCNNGTANTALYTGTLDDGIWSGVPIGFTFNFFGTNYTSVNVSTNGNLQFGAAANTSTAYTGVAIPTAGVPDNYIGAPWMDLDLTSSGSVVYKTNGTAPNRKFIIQWAAPVFLGSDNDTAQVVLNEGSNVINVYWNSFTNNASKVGTIGVENATGTAGTAITGRNGQTLPTTTAGEGYAFTPISAVTYAWSGPNGYSSTTQNTSIASAALTNTGTYSVTVTEPLTGCTASASTGALTVNQATTITCPAASITTNNDPGACTANVSIAPTILTGLPTPTITYTPSLPAGNNFPLGTSSYTISVSNSCGAAQTCAVNVNVIVGDPTSPIANPTYNAATLGWIPASGNGNFQVRWQLGAAAFNPNTTGNLVNAGTTPSVTLSSLAAVTTYHWYVRASCGSSGNWSNWVDAGTFTTTLAPPPANDNICGAFVLPYTNTQQVGYTTYGQLSSTQTCNVLTANNTNATIEAPAVTCGGTAYHSLWYQITAPDCGISGAVPFTIRFSTDNAQTDHNTQLDVFSSSNNTCSGTLTQVAGGCNDNRGANTGCSGNALTTTSTIVLSPVLVPGNTYFVRVSSATATGGNFGLTIAIEPPAPTITASSVPEKVNINLTPMGAVNHAYYYRQQGASGYAFSLSTSPSLLTGQLVPGNTYEFQGQYRCQMTNQLYRTPLVSYNLPGYTNCGSPSPLACSAPTNTTITLSWPSQAGAYTLGANSSGYVLYYRVTGTSGYNYFSNFVPTSCVGGVCTGVVTGLTPGTSYDVWIGVRCSSLNVLKSNTVTCVTTGPTAAPRPGTKGYQEDTYTFMVGNTEYHDVRLTDNWSDFGINLPENGNAYVDVSSGTARLLNAESGYEIASVPTAAKGEGMSFALIPNPTQENTHVVLYTSTTTDALCTVTDLQGNIISSEVLKDAVNGAMININTTDYAPGVYMVTVKTATEMMTQKLVVIK